MDSKTLDFYESNAATCAQRYEKADVRVIHQLLQRSIQQGCRVLEIGGGTGRDAAFLAASGCRVTFTDASPAMVAEAIRLHPELAIDARVACFPLTADSPLLEERFDLVLAMALIMHFDETDLDRFIAQLTDLLVPEGIAIISHSSGRSGLRDHRDSQQRLFHERTDEQLTALCRAHGLLTDHIDTNRDGLARTDILWSTHILRKPPP